MSRHAAHRYSGAYVRPSPLAAFRMAFDALFERNPRRRLALMNRQRDYLELLKQPERLALHNRLNGLLAGAAADWAAYDYGEGYFYQGSRRLGIRGLRDTDARIAAMDLAPWLHGKSVLEIGCNSGFLAVEMARMGAHVTAFDNNPFLVDTGREAAAFAGVGECAFHCSTFEDFPEAGSFDVVVSFANHATIDGNMSFAVEEFFAKCARLTKPGGVLLFESHPPAVEGDGLDAVAGIIAQNWRILDRRVLRYGTFLDDGRTFIAGEKLP